MFCTVCPGFRIAMLPPFPSSARRTFTSIPTPAESMNATFDMSMRRWECPSLM
jgi:hypothetical protein